MHMKEPIGQHHTECHDSEMDGAKQIGPQIATLHARVLALFEAYGFMTDEELLDRYVTRWGAISKNSLEPRRNELVREQQVMNTGLRKSGRSGVKRIVWGLVPKDGTLF
jgi:cytochrome c2